MESKIIAWGPYRDDIADFLDYPESAYFGVEKGTVVFSTLFCCVSSRQSKELADFLCIDYNNFNQYHFNNYQARMHSEWVDDNEPAIIYLEEYIPNAMQEWAALKKLIFAGFQFYFDPGF